MKSVYPHLNERANGWLHFLYQKATTPDDWSIDGEPLKWWDKTSTPPMCAFPRFDLQESAYAIGLMVDQTPAWREVYTTILEGISARFLTYWAAVDWLSQFGPDPQRKKYPIEWKGTLIPEEFWGEYDAPGWVANGIEPWGMQPDPIGADGNLFFKGWLNLTQALHTYTSGVDTWGEPFAMAGVNRTTFEWTQHSLVNHLRDQWQSTPMGPHCENTKAWPFCLSAAGLGLQLYDKLFDRENHFVYQDWLEFTADKYYSFDKNQQLERVTMYYDALKDHHHSAMPPMGLAIAFYALPQAPEFAEKLYRGAVKFMHWDDPASPIVPTPDPRMVALGLSVAKEFGDYTTESRLRTFAESYFEPMTFGLNDSQFGFWFNLGENWPRGQLSALAICSEIGEKNAWKNLFNQPNLGKFEEPTLTGVDFPAVSVRQAWNDLDSGVLHIGMQDGDGSKPGLQTHFSVENLPDSQSVFILCDGEPFTEWKRIDQNAIRINTRCGTHKFEIFTGYHPPKAPRKSLATKISQSSVSNEQAQRVKALHRQVNTQAEKIVDNFHKMQFSRRSYLPKAPVSSCACCVSSFI